MVRLLAKRASHVLGLMPVAHFLTATAPLPHLAVASAVVGHPVVKRFAPRLAAVATVGLAVVALAGFVKGLKTSRRSSRVATVDVGDLERSSVT
jgi:hypothetical protein